MPTLYLCGAGNSEGVRLAQTINQRQSRWDRIVILDDDPARRGQAILGVEIAGPFSLLRGARDSDEVANLVARTTVKRWTARSKIEDYGLPFAAMINPDVDTTGAQFGRDTIVYQYATIGPLVSMGEASVVFMGGVVGHGSKLGRCCIVAPNAVINARAQIGDGVYVGSNATILPEVKIGPWVTIGAGTVVTNNVPDGATVMGVPAKVILTLDVKLKLGAFRCLPLELRRELESRIQHAGSGYGRASREARIFDSRDQSMGVENGILQTNHPGDLRSDRRDQPVAGAETYAGEIAEYDHSRRGNTRFAGIPQFHCSRRGEHRENVQKNDQRD